MPLATAAFDACCCFLDDRFFYFVSGTGSPIKPSFSPYARRAFYARRARQYHLSIPIVKYKKKFLRIVYARREVVLAIILLREDATMLLTSETSTYLDKIT